MTSSAPNFIPAVLGYLTNDDNKVLMMLRNKKPGDIHKGKWNGLGGKIEQGESPEEAFRREVQEESGLQIVKPTLAGMITFPKFDGVSDWLAYVFTCSNFSGNIGECPEGELHWVPRNELQELNLWPGDRYFLRWIQAEIFFSAKIVYYDKMLTQISADLTPQLTA